MPDENPNPETKPEEQAPEEKPEEKPTDSGEQNPEQKPEEKPEETDEAKQVAELPDWAQSLVKNLRAENANYRTRATSAEQKLGEAKTPEEVEAAVTAVKEENARLARELLVSTVARKFELPAELAEVLKGDDEAALEAHAKTLAKFAGSDESTDPKGGLNPDNGSDGFDPVKAARAARRRRF